jgi:hypothetical protein
MPFEQRELAFQAKDAAMHVLSIFLTSSEYWCVKLLLSMLSRFIVTPCFSALPCDTRSKTPSQQLPSQRFFS